MDKFPWRWFASRMLDMCLYLLVLFLAIDTMFFSSFVPEASGIIILIIGIYAEHRQNSHYSMCHIENSLISGEIIRSPVHQIAKVRSSISKLNVLIIVLGTLLTSWSTFR